MMHQALIVLRWLSYLLVFSSMVACGLKGDLYLPTENNTAANGTPATAPTTANNSDDEQEEDSDGL